MANKKNLANGILASPVSDTDTTAILETGHGARFPATPFFVTATPDRELSTIDNSEIWLVTGVSTDTLTIERTQFGTTAKEFEAGAIVANGVYVDDIDSKEDNAIEVSVTTAAATAAKVGTTDAGDYTPVYGDRINVSFTLGCNVNNPTLNIDGSGAVNIRLGVTNVSTSLLGIAAAVKVPMWFDGTYWQIYGSFHNTNTTYSEISEAEAANAASSTTRLITGRRLQTAISNAIAAITGFVKSSTTDRLTVSDTAPSSPATGDVWIDTNDLPEELAPTSIVWKETPGGTKDGANTDFTTSQAYISGSLQLFINGVAQSGMVSEDAPGSGQFSITPAPESDDDLSVQYQVRTTSTGNADTLDGYHANATPTANNIPVLDSDAQLPYSSIKKLDYSTTEQDTGIKWIDGATIYKKTINFGALPNNTTKTVSHGINWAWLVDFEAMAGTDGGSTMLPTPFVGDGGSAPYSQYSLVLRNNSTIDVKTTSNRSSLTLYVTLYYTK